MGLYNSFNDDFDCAENIECVHVVPAGTQDLRSARARRRAVRTGEAGSSNGVYSVRDSVFTFLKCELDFSPGLGTLIYTADREELWSVFEVFNTVRRTRYQCFAHRGFLQADLTDRVTIEKNVGGKDSNLAPKKKWLAILSNYPAKFQETGNTVGGGQDRTMIVREGQVYVMTDRNLEAGMRVLINGTAYNVSQVTGKGDIGLAQVLDVVEARTPGA